MLDIISDNDTKKNLYWSIYNSHELIENFKNDIRFHDLVKRYNKKERIILTFKEDDIVYSVLARKSEIVDYREDEDVKIIEIIEMWKGGEKMKQAACYAIITLLIITAYFF